MDRSIETHAQAPAHHGNPRLVLVALEPRAYSEAIGQTIAALRPGLQVLVVEPQELPAENDCWVPALVLCSRPAPEGRGDVIRWAEYRPYEDPDVVRVDGRAERIPGLQLEDLLGLVDRLTAKVPSGRLSSR